MAAPRNVRYLPMNGGSSGPSRMQLAVAMTSRRDRMPARLKAVTLCWPSRIQNQGDSHLARKYDKRCAVHAVTRAVLILHNTSVHGVRLLNLQQLGHLPHMGHGHALALQARRAPLCCSSPLQPPGCHTLAPGCPGAPGLLARARRPCSYQGACASRRRWSARPRAAPPARPAPGRATRAHARSSRARRRPAPRWSSAPAAWPRSCRRAPRRPPRLTLCLGLGRWGALATRGPAAACCRRQALHWQPDWFRWLC